MSAREQRTLVTPNAAWSAAAEPSGDTALAPDFLSTHGRARVLFLGLLVLLPWAPLAATIESNGEGTAAVNQSAPTGDLLQFADGSFLHGKLETVA